MSSMEIGWSATRRDSASHRVSSSCSPLRVNALSEASSGHGQLGIRERTIQQTGGAGGTVKKVDKATIVALALFFVSICVVLAAGITAVWLTEEVRVFGLVILPTGIVGSLLVVYFDWRAKVWRRMAEGDRYWTAA